MVDPLLSRGVVVCRLCSRPLFPYYESGRSSLMVCCLIGGQSMVDSGACTSEVSFVPALGPPMHDAGLQTPNPIGSNYFDGDSQRQCLLLNRALSAPSRLRS